jgi:hypothetical protein
LFPQNVFIAVALTTRMTYTVSRSQEPKLVA